MFENSEAPPTFFEYFNLLFIGALAISSPVLLSLPYFNLLFIGAIEGDIRFNRFSNVISISFSSEQVELEVYKCPNCGNFNLLFIGASMSSVVPSVVPPRISISFSSELINSLLFLA